MPNAIAATLTFRRRLDGHPLTLRTAEEAVRMLIRRLNYRGLGRDHRTRGQRLSVVPVREGGFEYGDSHLHYHLQIEIPEGWATETWIAVARAEWERIQWAAEQAAFEVVRDAGWLSYIFKTRDKRDFGEAIDLGNLWIN